MRWRRRREPEAPSNVRAITPDGTQIPLEIVYRGTDTDGIHVWEATARVPLEQGCQLHIDVLPPRTAVHVLDRE